MADAVLAEPVERDARHADEQAAIERDLALHDALGDREHELHDLALGPADHLAAQRRRAPRSSAASRRSIASARVRGRFGAGPLALRVALGERVALDARPVALDRADAGGAGRRGAGGADAVHGGCRSSAPSETASTPRRVVDAGAP